MKLANDPSHSFQESFALSKFPPLSACRRRLFPSDHLFRVSLPPPHYQSLPSPFASSSGFHFLCSHMISSAPFDQVSFLSSMHGNGDIGMLFASEVRATARPAIACANKCKKVENVGSSAVERPDLVLGEYRCK